MDVHEKQLCQILCAYRIFLPFVGITVSSRESAAFRNGIVNVVLCSDDTVNVLIDVEYQKKRKERERDRAALHV